MSFASPASRVLARIDDADRFVVESTTQRRVVHYEIGIAETESGLASEPLFVVEQQTLRFTQDISFRADSTGAGPLFIVKTGSLRSLSQEWVDVEADGQTIGRLNHSIRSIYRERWRVSAGEVGFVAREARLVDALWRRFTGTDPDDATLPCNFTLTREGELAGAYTRLTDDSRTRFLLELGPPLARLDRRVAVAWAVAALAL